MTDISRQTMKCCILILGILWFVPQAHAQYSERITPNRIIKYVNGKFGVTDALNKKIVPFLYDRIKYANNRLIVRKGANEGLLTLDNKVVVPIKYRFVFRRGYGRFFLWTHNSLYGLADTNGKLVIPVIHKSLSSTLNDDYYLSGNEKVVGGIYDVHGNKVFLESYHFFTLDGYKVFAIKDGQPLILDVRDPIKTVYLEKDITLIDTRRHFAMGEKFFQIVKQKGKYGLMNSNNETVIPIIYDHLKQSGDWEYYLITKHGKTGIIYINGTIVKEAVYDQILLRKEHAVLKRKGFKDEIYYYP